MSHVDERELERGRASYERRAWSDAHAALRSADARGSLGTGDLQRLATAAYMLGRDDEYVQALERAHRIHLADGDILPAARCAFWIGINLAVRGEPARAAGWHGRAERLVERAGGECVERGFLLLVRDARARGGRRPRRGARGRSRGDRARRALRRSRSVRAGRAGSGHPPDQERALRRGPAAARRGDGGRHGRGALADRQRVRLLRRDPRLPGGPGAAPGAGVDGGADALVRAAARPGELHRHLPRAPRRDHAAARRLDRGARRGRARARAVRAGGERAGGRGGALPAGRGPSPAR